jgi:UDP-3-O-[3-hydroxymyristoyl] glucosamine N-acyltransferase|tara:strand:+ start:831 stop:1826 length:996 start_codon:yes stop_codon:yes gene_type:complete
LIDRNFYKYKGSLSLFELTSKLNLDFYGDKNFKISDISTLELAHPNEISFFHNSKYLSLLKKTKAGVIILKKNDNLKMSEKKNLIYSDNPYYTMAEVASLFYPNCEYPDHFFRDEERKKNIDPSTKCSLNSFVHKDSIIGKNCIIGSHVKIGSGVKISDGCIIGDNVNIYYALLSKNVKVYSGAIIGGDGFGFVPGKNGIKKVPQLGRVIIKENVEIGCNSTIDRGSIGDTVLSENVMIDNLVHIAHNVIIGKNTIIAAMTGISGSTEIGDNVLIGGQVGISGHLKIGDNVKIAAKSGVMKDIPNNSSVGGYPALNIIDWHRSTLMSRKKK